MSFRMFRSELVREYRQGSWMSPRLPIIIETVSGINITEVKHAVAARPSDDDVSRHLAISDGSPVLWVERDYLYRKETIVRSVGLYRSDLFSYKLTLKRKKH